MKVWKFSSLFLIFVVFPFECVIAGSLLKDAVIASILYQILKPRFVPLPLPFPLPIKFKKNTYKPYPVPVYSHQLSAHQVEPLHLSHSHQLSAHQVESLPLSHGASAGYSHHEGIGDIETISHFSGSEALHQLHDVSNSIIDLTDQLKHSSGISGSETYHVDSTHDDIEAVGGFDLLTDLDELGGDKKWW